MASGVSTVVEVGCFARVGRDRAADAEGSGVRERGELVDELVRWLERVAGEGVDVVLQADPARSAQHFVRGEGVEERGEHGVGREEKEADHPGRDEGEALQRLLTPSRRQAAMDESDKSSVWDFSNATEMAS